MANFIVVASAYKVTTALLSFPAQFIAAKHVTASFAVDTQQEGIAFTFTIALSTELPHARPDCRDDPPSHAQTAHRRVEKSIQDVG